MSLSVLLRLTLSGSALALLLLAMRYVFFKKMPSTAYYYAWLLVLLRFVLPLPGLVPDLSGESAAPVTVIATPAPLERAPLSLPQAEGFQPVSDIPPAASSPIREDAVRASEPVKRGLNLKSPALWLTVWAAGAGISLLFYVLSYALFTAQVRRSLSPATREDRQVYARLGGRRPRLYRCAACGTPLMFGVFQPIITLPERDYDEELLTNILRHELTHYRRRDPLYKWFAVAVLSTQWFNPLSWLIRRELNRACELSCDERLLRDMDRADKLSYGHTLLNMAESAALPAGVVATTFSTEKRNLKERLEQIMNYKKSTARMLAAVLALLLLAGCAAMAGPAPTSVAAEPKRDAENVVRITTVDELLAAIAPDTVIKLAAGTYDLSAAADYGQDTHSSYYSWNGAYDGFELNLHNVENLTLRGAGKGETVIAAVPRYANVLRFTGCKNVTVENLTAGHTIEPGWCQGGVLYFETTESAEVSGCGLYGCGIIGVQARDCAELTVKDSEIYECSYGAVDVHQCRDTRVEGCDIHDHGVRVGQGEAMNLFSVSYSDGFTVYNCRVHDNRAQVLLNSSYTKSALFLSNDVTGNAFGSSVFAFQQSGATVDGCRFEANDVSHGWYSGSGIYANDIEGNALVEGAQLAEMMLRDIPPEKVAPKPASLLQAAEIPVGGEVSVKTVDELLACIGPDRTIVLDGELFDLSTASNYGGIGTEYYYWKENPDGPGLVIHDVNGLSIRAGNTASGATTLAAIPRWADVLSFRNCDNLFLGGFTAGHTKEPGVCSGGVLSFQNCNQVMIEKMRLYGCGILGIQTSQCSSLNILRTEIYECSQGAGIFFQTDGINFESCDVHDVPSPALVFNECGDKIWNGQPLSGLNSRYDVDANGNLIVYETLQREEEAEFHGGVNDLDNSFAAEPEQRLAADDPRVKFAGVVQQAIVSDDWASLATWIAFPIQFFTSDYSFVIHDRAEYMQMVQDGYFTNELFTDTFKFRQRIADADPTVFGSCVFGETCLDHMIAIACYGSKVTEDNLMINAFSVKTPLWPGRSEAAYVQAVPPTPMPSSETEGLQVLFYETEIKTDFTLWPSDPTELHAEISSELAAGAAFEWETDKPSVLRIEKTGTNTANITCVDDGTLPQTCKLTVSCGGLQKELTVYCRPK